MPAPPGPPRSVLRPAATYFALVFGAGFLLGMVRVPILVPRLGERLAELSEMPVMFLAIYFAARRVTRRDGPRSALAWIGVGTMALGLLLAAELGLAVLLQSRTLTDYIASRDPVSGSVYLAMLGLYAVMPWHHARRATAQPNRA